MLRVTFDDGESRVYSDDEVIEIENFPRRSTPKDGWFQIRDYPPEYARCTPLRVGVLHVGSRVRLNQGLVAVAGIERIPNE